MESRYDKALYTPGQRACPGCGASLAARLIIEAAGPETIVVTATGCVETFTSPYAYSPWGVPWLHPLFENAAAVASGVAAGVASAFGALLAHFFWNRSTRPAESTNFCRPV